MLSIPDYTVRPEPRSYAKGVTRLAITDVMLIQLGESPHIEVVIQPHLQAIEIANISDELLLCVRTSSSG
jgi:hypothetical protein